MHFVLCKRECKAWQFVYESSSSIWASFKLAAFIEGYARAVCRGEASSCKMKRHSLLPRAQDISCQLETGLANSVLLPLTC